MFQSDVDDRVARLKHERVLVAAAQAVMAREARRTHYHDGFSPVATELRPARSLNVSPRTPDSVASVAADTAARTRPAGEVAARLTFALG